MSLPSKREFLSLHTNPATSKPFAVFPGRGRFSAEAEAFATAHASEWAEAVAVPAQPKAPKQPKVSLAKTPKAPKVSLVKKEKPKVSEQRAERPTPLLMPKRRKENSGFTTVGGILIRQDRCGNGNHTVAQCPCPTGPRAYKWLEKEVGGPLVLTLDKPAL